MTYPKPFMSITELVNFTGISRNYFKEIAIASDAPVVKTAKGGKAYFITEKLDNYMQTVSNDRKR